LKKLLLPAVLLVTAISSSAATIAPCPTGANGVVSLTLDQFLTNGAFAGGCEIGDKLFNHFSYTGGGVAASNVGVTITRGSGGIVYQTLFAPLAGSWTAGFNLGFTISVDTAIAPNNQIVQVKDQMNSSQNQPPPILPNASMSVTTSTPGGTLTLLGILGQETNQTPLFAATSVIHSITYDPNGAPGNGPAGQLFSFEVDTVQGTIPEPATFAFMGGGLVIVAVLRRRKSS
jgi:hypothetical protein